jgi:site-specific DNA recombinase
MFFFDDHTGFTFEDRTKLNEFRAEVQVAPRSNKLVMEYPDRLSRDHAWRYGFLREEFNNCGIEFIYWKGYHSEVERSVIGAISEQGMRQELERMHDGMLRKAQKGHIIAKQPAYGYQFVDDSGRPRTDPASKWRKETNYAILPEESAVMVRIYGALAYQGGTLIQLANQLNAEGVKPPKSCQEWEASLISKLVKNTVYRGEFVAHRWYFKKTRSKRTGNMVSHRYERPKEEWIVVPVPATVSKETWELANLSLKKNSTQCKRNLRYDALLVGLLVCATCNAAYIFSAREMRQNGKVLLVVSYRCCSRTHRTRQARERIGCHQSQIAARRLDKAVWKVVSQILLHPELITEAMDVYYRELGMGRLHAQIAYIEQQEDACAQRDDRLYRAYDAGAFDAAEYGARRRLIKEELAHLEEEKKKLEGTLISEQEFQERKRRVLAISEEARSGLNEVDVPFADKRRLVRLVVDKVILDVNNGRFTLLGAIKGTYTLQGNDFACSSAATDS